LKAADFMRKAESSLGAAHLLLDGNYTDEARSRAYYAMFDAARPALLAAGAPVESEVARTHRGLISGFARYVVKPGLISQVLGRSFAQAQQVRLLADYDGDPIDPEDARRIVDSAAIFIQTISETFDSVRE
jgi:uncharacterized protein (UPF0332 family)